MKAASELTDEELAFEIREQVNASRNFGRHDRARTRAIASEANRRGWGLAGKHSESKRARP